MHGNGSFFLSDRCFKRADNHMPYFFVSHADWGAYLIRSSLSSLTVIRIARAQARSGIQCVERTGSPTCPRVWLDATPPLALARTRSDTHHTHETCMFFSKRSMIFRLDSQFSFISYHRVACDISVIIYRQNKCFLLCRSSFITELHLVFFSVRCSTIASVSRWLIPNQAT